MAAVSMHNGAMSLSGEAVTAWILTDGKAGDLAQCEGLTSCLGLAPEVRVVAPRPPWVWGMPWGPIDPREGPDRPGGPLAPPFPDIAVASGRRTVAYLKRLKQASAGATFTVYLKDPRTGAGAADVIWVPEHDRLRGPNVLVTATAPHRIRAETLARLRAAPPAEIAAMPRPRVAVLVGGPSALYAYDDGAIADFALRLRRAASEAGSFLVTMSRRTPPALAEAAAIAIRGVPATVWRGSGPNPYAAFLALSDIIVATADSANMVGEALAAGRPVMVYTPPGRRGRVGEFSRALLEKGLVRPFTGALEIFASAPVDSTPQIAAEIAARFRTWKAGAGRAGQHRTE